MAAALQLCGKSHADGNQLLTSCQALLRSLSDAGGDTVSFETNFETGVCWGSISTLQDLSIIWDPKAGGPLFNLCLPPESRLTQLIRVVVHDLESNPSTIHNKAGLLAYEALSKAYKCPN